MKKKNFYLILLLVLAMVIWSHNAYQIFIGVTQSDQEMENLAAGNHWELPDTLSSLPHPPQAFVYQAAFRDPFENWLRQEDKRPQPIKIAKPEPILPRLRLSGIVRDGTGMLAIIEGPDGEMQFLQPQDIIAGVTIISIDSGRVTCKFDKKRFQLFLQP